MTDEYPTEHVESRIRDILRRKRVLGPSFMEFEYPLTYAFEFFRENASMFLSRKELSEFGSPIPQRIDPEPAIRAYCARTNQPYRDVIRELAYADLLLLNYSHVPNPSRLDHLLFQAVPE